MALAADTERVLVGEEKQQQHGRQRQHDADEKNGRQRADVPVVAFVQEQADGDGRTGYASDLKEYKLAGGELAPLPRRYGVCKNRLEGRGAQALVRAPHCQEPDDERVPHVRGHPAPVPAVIVEHEYGDPAGENPHHTSPLQNGRPGILVCQIPTKQGKNCLRKTLDRLGKPYVQRRARQHVDKVAERDERPDSSACRRQKRVRKRQLHVLILPRYVHRRLSLRRTHSLTKKAERERRTVRKGVHTQKKADKRRVENVRETKKTFKKEKNPITNQHNKKSFPLYKNKE